MADIPCMNDTLNTLANMLRLVCSVLILAAYVGAGLVVAVLASAFVAVTTFGVLDWSTELLIACPAIGAAFGVRGLLPAKKPAV